MTGPYSILLADDHVMFREAVKRIIESIADAEVVGEASDGFELLELLKKLSPQLVVLDISMPNLRGLEATREIKNINPAVKVLILTMHKDNEYVDFAFSAGAEGYLLKEDSQSELLLAIDTLRKGGTYLSPLLSTKLVDLSVQKIFRTATELSDSRRELLTIREQEIIKLIAEGNSSKEIAGLLFISAMTVQKHRANIKKKLKVSKNADLVKYAIQKGYTVLGL